MPKIRLKGYVLVPAEALTSIQRALPKHIELSRQEQGCLSFNVEQDAQNPQKFNVSEAFVDQQAFDDHQHRVKASEWGRLSLNVSRHYSIEHEQEQETQTETETENQTQN